MKREVITYSVEEITKLIKLNPATLETLPDTKIKLNIEYQRGIVYSAEKQASIIESILKDFAIPSIVLWRNIDDDTFDVIDGKQRLTSIFLFLSGNLQINYYGNTKKYYSQIREDDKKRIKNYTLPFIIMSGDRTEEQYKHELFEILNSTAVSLNKWELLQGSYYGNFLNTFKEEVQNPLNVEIQNEFNFRDKSKPSHARYAGCYKLLSLHLGNDSEIKKYVEINRHNSGQQFYNREIKNILTECSKLPEPGKIDIYYDIIREIISNNDKYQSYNNARENIIQKLKEFYQENVYIKVKGNDLKIIIRNIFELESGSLQLDPKRNYTSKDREALYKIYVAKRKDESGKIRCPKCGRLFDYKDMHMDHIIPYKLGGRTELENAQFLCSTCNLSKGAN